MRRLVWLATAVGLVVAFSAPPARAHGVIDNADPARGARVQDPPEAVVVTMTEAPVRGSVFVVTDGCGDEVSQEPQLSGQEVTIPIAAGEPGRWRVRFEALSSVDGHLVEGGYRFRVAGERDCSAPEDPETEAPDDDDQESPPPVAEPPGDEGSSFPVVPVALGTVGIIGIAVLARFMGTR